MALTCTKCGGVIADIGGHIGVCVTEQRKIADDISEPARRSLLKYANPPSTPTSTDTKIEETKKPTSKDELNVLATDSDDIITKILFELKYGKNFSGTANLKKINEATTALKTLLTSEKNKARIEEVGRCLDLFVNTPTHQFVKELNNRLREME